MAATGAPASSLRLVPHVYFLLVLLSQPGQSQSSLNAGKVPGSDLSIKEMSEQLFLKYLTFLETMEMAWNASCAAGEEWSQREARLGNKTGAQVARVEDALRLHHEQVLDVVEEGQQNRTQEILKAINTTVQDTFTKLREEMRQEIERMREELPHPKEELPTHLATKLQNDSLPSLCNGTKVLVGSIGTLEVVKNGTYPSDLLCSWNITLPVKAPLSLTWVYIDTEGEDTCKYDYVKVEDLNYSDTPVYGGKLCGSFAPWMIEVMNVVLPPTKNILVTFRSDESNEKRGFRLHYKVQPY